MSEIILNTSDAMVANFELQFDTTSIIVPHYGEDRELKALQTEDSLIVTTEGRIFDEVCDREYQRVRDMAESDKRIMEPFELEFNASQIFKFYHKFKEGRRDLSTIELIASNEVVRGAKSGTIIFTKSPERLKDYYNIIKKYETNACQTSEAYISINNNTNLSDDKLDNRFIIRLDKAINEACGIKDTATDKFVRYYSIFANEDFDM